MKDKVIFLVDMQSYYASVEKASNPGLKGKPVVVSGDPERRAGVILAACPLAKKRGVRNGERLWEAQQKCPEAAVVRPRMQLYIDVSIQITNILERYTDLVEPFSIDEQFMDVTGSQRLFGDPLSMARKVQKDIMKETGLYARIGIGSNKMLAKLACDNFGKKNVSGIFELNADNLAEYLWSLPIGKMFGIGKRMEKNLLARGIGTIGSLANFPLDLLKKKWGINGHVLWMTANGLDYSPVTKASLDGQKAIGHGMTLPKDYERAEEIKVVLLELCEEVCFRARSSQVRGSTISVSCSGASFDVPAGFHRQRTIDEPTNHAMEMFRCVWGLFLEFWDGQPVRRLGISLSSLAADDVWQLSFFDHKAEKRELDYAIDRIKQRFGMTAVVRAASLRSAGQVFERAQKIGGHYK
ncbi:DNA polymerase IV [Bacillus massiliglaciei]|uniref:DNA polymerase IV n=1 Tax=Bacillus massiliglaciei TaxID=1816693 RepID=UPI000B1B4007|nr:DNA polymerase IV [Bacillus massiliglaciei]